MKRRDFITLLSGAAAWPLAATAQQAAKLHRIFWASTESQPDPFVDGLRERGYIEGVNVVLELRYAPGNPDALHAVISELTRRNWDLAVSSGPAIRAMKAATDVPVLFAISGDPVELGLVKTLARPGGNFTGSTFLSLDLAGKRVQLLKDTFPQLRTLAVLSNTDHPVPCFVLPGGSSALLPLVVSHQLAGVPISAHLLVFRRLSEMLLSGDATQQILRPEQRLR